MASIYLLTKLLMNVFSFICIIFNSILFYLSMTSMIYFLFLIQSYRQKLQQNRFSSLNFLFVYILYHERTSLGQIVIDGGDPIKAYKIMVSHVARNEEDQSQFTKIFKSTTVFINKNQTGFENSDQNAVGCLSSLLKTKLYFSAATILYFVDFPHLHPLLTRLLKQNIQGVS